MQRIAALLLIIGTAVAWFGESRPIILETYGGAPNPQSIIEANPTAWQVAMLGMAAGAIIAAVGLLLLIVHMRRLDDNKTMHAISTIAAVLALISSFAYAASRTISAVSLLWETPYGTLDMALGIIYGLGWQIALMLAGYLLLRGGYPKWLAWPVMIIAGLFLVANVVTGGLPPGLYYFVVLFMGIALLFVRTPRPVIPAGAQLESSTA